MESPESEIHCEDGAVAVGHLRRCRGYQANAEKHRNLLPPLHSSPELGTCHPRPSLYVLGFGLRVYCFAGDDEPEPCDLI